jgi:uncharacterized protein (TIGR00255 family)
MLLSMTGYGEARHQDDRLFLAIELRSLNNRYLKVAVRASEPYHLLEPEFEKVVRRWIRRGTVTIHMRCERAVVPSDFKINAVALRSYIGQIRDVCEAMNLRDKSELLLAQALALPGVAPEPGGVGHDIHEDWPIVERVLEEALARLQAMRQEEGRAMSEELLQLRTQVAAQLDRIRERIPHVVACFRDRLHDRVRQLLAEEGVQLDPADLIREAAIFAERSDIAEEVTRLDSHLDQFRDAMNESESPGRKLEFLTQEMFREANTIGSKAGDVEIARHAVEIKTTLERIRELVQNIE